MLEQIAGTLLLVVALVFTLLGWPAAAIPCAMLGAYCYYLAERI